MCTKVKGCLLSQIPLLDMHPSTGRQYVASKTSATPYLPNIIFFWQACWQAAIGDIPRARQFIWTSTPTLNLFMPSQAAQWASLTGMPPSSEAVIADWKRCLCQDCRSILGRLHVSWMTKCQSCVCYVCAHL